MLLESRSNSVVVRREDERANVLFNVGCFAVGLFKVEGPFERALSHVSGLVVGEFEVGVKQLVRAFTLIVAKHLLK